MSRLNYPAAHYRSLSSFAARSLTSVLSPRLPLRTAVAPSARVHIQLWTSSSRSHSLWAQSNNTEQSDQPIAIAMPPAGEPSLSGPRITNASFQT